MTQIPVQCPDCGGNVKFIPAGISRKTDKPYKEFYSCEKRCGWTWREGKEPQKPMAQTETTKDLIIIEKLDEINDRLDKLAIYLKEKLEL